MKRPGWIQIGPTRWLVVYTEAATEAMRARNDNPRMMGETDAVTATIIIAHDLPADLKRETLLHEILHAIQATLGNQAESARKGDVEETFVASTSPLLLDTLERNPDLVTYLLDRVP